MELTHLHLVLLQPIPYLPHLLQLYIQYILCLLMGFEYLGQEYVRKTLQEIHVTSVVRWLDLFLHPRLALLLLPTEVPSS